MNSLIPKKDSHSSDITFFLKEKALEEGMSLGNIVKLKKIEKGIINFFKDKEVKEFIIEEVVKENGGVCVDNVTIENRASRTTYDYSICKHPVLEKINEIKKVLFDLEKNVKSHLNSIGEGKSQHLIIESLPELTETPHGEMVEIFGSIKKTTDGVFFTEKKV